MRDLDIECRDTQEQINALVLKLREMEHEQRKLGKSKCRCCDGWFYELFPVVIHPHEFDPLTYWYCAACTQADIDRQVKKRAEDAEESRQLLAGEIPLRIGVWRKTRPGCVYVIHDHRFNFFKVGATSSNLRSRTQAYGRIHAGGEIEFVMAILSPRPFEFEAFLHRRFNDKRPNGGEAFTLDADDLSMLASLETTGAFPAYQPLRVVNNITAADEWIQSQEVPAIL
jgi:hypothetical protein